MAVDLFFYQHQVFLNTVVFHKVPGVYMVNVIEVIIKKIAQIDRLSRVHAASLLRIVKIELLAPESAFRCICDLLAPVPAFLLALSVKVKEFLLAAVFSLLLIFTVDISGHFHKDFGRRAPHDFDELTNDQNCLPYHSPDRCRYV